MRSERSRFVGGLGRCSHHWIEELDGGACPACQGFCVVCGCEEEKFNEFGVCDLCQACVDDGPVGDLDFYVAAGFVEVK